MVTCLWMLLIRIGTRKIGDVTCGRSLLLASGPAGNLDMDPLEQSMQRLGFADSIRTTIQEKLHQIGFCDSSELVMLARDFVDRPEVFSSLLQEDFHLDPLMAHRTRVAVMNMITQESKGSSIVENKEIAAAADTLTLNGVKKPSQLSGDFISYGVKKPSQVSSETDTSLEVEMNQDEEQDATRPLYKSVVVNEKSRKRHLKALGTSKDNHEYGLPSHYRDLHPVLAKELDDFLTFMTHPSTASQEAPIKMATASVYLQHAKLFLGWYITQYGEDSLEISAPVSLYTIVPSKERQSADCLLEFIMWLRISRNISVSYEANVLRGLVKLLKFRFAAESETDPTYGEKSFDDIPVIRELRKLHRDANKRQTLAPRSSDETQKWLSWSEYLQVIQGIKNDLLKEIDAYEMESSKPQRSKKGTKAKGSSSQRKIAIMYQQYLILSFLASVPDRQRTIRELELNRSFIRDKTQNVWVIKHGPDDYKTGKTYGDRPPMVLSPALVPEIDDFLERWRPCLMPNSEHVFVQQRTGNPLTQDSVYQIVSRSCYKYSGKRTNPHLLRDMIVTHVRESDASEKQLEALALYMGHSIQMQRTSYDRRTLTKKVAPAVELLQSVNKLESNE